MTQSNAERLYAIVGSLFEVDPATITDESSQDTIERWDSLGMVNLISEMEAAFGVEFDLLQIAEFRNIASIKEALRVKGVDIA